MLFKSHSAQFSTREPFIHSQEDAQTQESLEFPLKQLWTKADAVSDRIHKMIVSRLQAQHQSTSNLIPPLTRFLTMSPKISNAETAGEKERLLQRLLSLTRNNVLVSDTRYGRRTRAQRSNRRIYRITARYVGSWAVNARDMLRLLNRWKEEGIDVAQVAPWMLAVRVKLRGEKEGGAEGEEGGEGEGTQGGEGAGIGEGGTEGERAGETRGKGKGKEPAVAEEEAEAEVAEEEEESEAEAEAKKFRSSTLPDSSATSENAQDPRPR